MTAFVSKIAGFMGSSGGEMFGPFTGAHPAPQATGGGFMDILSTGLNLASMGAQIFGAHEEAEAQILNARAEARALERDAEEQELEAQREETRGKEDANNIMDNLLQTLAEQRAGFAANGVDLGFGTPVDLAKSTREVARRQLSISRNDAQARSLARRRQQQALLEERGNVLRSGGATAKNTKLKGYIGAIGTAAELAERRVRRG